MLAEEEGVVVRCDELLEALLSSPTSFSGAVFREVRTAFSLLSSVFFFFSSGNALAFSLLFSPATKCLFFLFCSFAFFLRLKSAPMLKSAKWKRVLRSAS